MGHKPKQNETCSDNIIKLLRLHHEVTTFLMNRLNNAIFSCCLLLLLKLKHFCGAFKKTVLAKRYIIKRIMNNFC